MGSKTESRHLTDDGAAHLKWDEIPAQGITPRIKSIYLFPTLQATKKASLPESLRFFPALEFLYLPIGLLPGIAKWTDFPHLRSLMIDYPKSWERTISGNQLIWPDLVLSQLTEIRLLRSFGAAEPSCIAGLDGTSLLGIKYLGFSLGKSLSYLPVLPSFSQLRSLHIEETSDHDVFAYLPAQLQSLSLYGLGAKFPFQHIGSFQQLSQIFINTAKTAIDAGLFTQLGALTELTIINSSKILQPELLLNCRQLNKLTLVNCKAPFSKALKSEFKAMTNLEVDIDFA